jgi:hypothetical protein
MKSFVVLAVLIAVGIGAAVHFVGRTAARTTSTLLAYPDEAASATARANVAAALTAVEAYGAANGGYAGATPAGLAGIDAGLGSTITLHDLSATSFCVQSAVRTSIASASGPGGAIVDAPCP